MTGDRVRPIGLHGDEPKRLALSDGSRLLLDCESGDHDRVAWRRVGWRRRAGTNRISVNEASSLAGEEFAEYVRVRTRAEAEWMKAVADWYSDQADALYEELERSRSA
jgi:hypothetical protein